ncbi:Ubx domain-containing protein [Coemansia sp. RSA 1813]|nr:Ubx domain-containing protein [Coemansia sp. RSA 487]KAJ2569965.1 Ubx domain-containing protein [Coemansia sp. RSA 1813]
MAGPAEGDHVGVLLESLTDDERKHLFEFCDATAMEDLGAAVSILRSKDWDIGQALQSFFESPNNAANTGSTNSTSGLRQRATASIREQNRTNESQARNDTQQSARHLDSNSNHPSFALVPLVAWPFMLFLQLILFFIRSFLTLIGLGRIAAAGIPGADDNNSTPFSNHTPETRGNGSTSDAAQFKDYFERIYGSNHPPFFAGTYTRALETARRELKYLVVILWSKEHDDTERFGQALTHSRVIEFLSSPRYIVWVGDVSCSEAYRAAARLGVSAYPFVGLAALKPEPQLGTGSSGNNRFRLQVVARIEGLAGPVDANNTDALARELVRRLGAPIEANEQALHAARREQEARDSDRRIREQQNAAYEASLARDRERERLAREREQSEHAQRAEEERRQRELKNWENRREQWRWATLARIVREEKNDSNNSGNAGDGIPAKKRSAGRLQLRLEDGTRLVKTFAADTTMQDVFDFVETRGVAKEWEALKTTPHGDDLDAIQFPEEYTHEYDFALVSQFPRVVFDHTDATLGDVMAAQGLWPSAALIVEPLFESESESESEPEDKQDNETSSN